MGRTNSTYRNHLDSFIERFEGFRRGLRQENKKHLDALWEKAHRHSQAAAYMNPSSPGLPAVVSILTGLQKQVEENSERLERLQSSEKPYHSMEDGEGVQSRLHRW